MKRKCIFLVQGEGRGHMTQAIALSRILRQNGHELNSVFIGVSDRRRIPGYFLEQIGCTVTPLRSPNFVLDKKNKSLRLFASVFYNLLQLPAYLRSLRALNATVKSAGADVLINFYDILGGLYFLLYRPPIHHVAIGHQFLAAHPAFPFAGGRPVEKWLFKTNNSIMSLRATKKLALSFRPYRPKTAGKTMVVPPLMREEVQNLTVTDDRFILAYIVNDGYGEEVLRWHQQNRSVIIHCFWDRKGAPEEYRPHKNLTFHQISGSKFIAMMAACSGYVTTAGFESICEAMFLGKPVLMIPAGSQYEQACNALDAERAGAGISANRLDISRLLDYISAHVPVADQFRAWAAQTEKRILQAVEQLQ